MSFEKGVLEGSGLHFGTPRPRFRSLRASIWESPRSTVGSGGVPPWGPSIRRPTLVGNGVLDLSSASSVWSLNSSSKFFGQNSYPSLFFSLPRAPPAPQTRRQKAEKFAFFDFWTDFFAFQNALRFWHRKIIEKYVKNIDFGVPNPSPNPSKINAKSMSQKTCHISLIVVWCFHFCWSSISWKLASRLDGSTIFKVFAVIMLLLFPTVFHPKNLPKILPKRRLNDQKIDFKNACVFIIDFFAFGRRFWSLLGLQDGAKLAILAPKNFGTCPFEPS